MDARNRITAFDEFQIGKMYMWKKGHRYRGPITCVDLRTKIHAVIMEENGERFTYSCKTWPNRFIDAGIGMQELSLFPDLKGSIPVDVLEKRLTEYKHQMRLKRKRFPGQACGNCDYFDTMLLMCWNEHNMCGDRCCLVSHNAWCPYWKRSTGF